MKLNLPISATPAVVARAGGLKLAFPILGGTAVGAIPSAGLNVEVLRAAAAAVAAASPADSLEAAKAAQEDLAKALGARIDTDKLNTVLVPVVEARSDPKRAPKPTAAQIAAADAIGARRDLTAAAGDGIDSGANKADRDALAKAARTWVTSVKGGAQMLETAALATSVVTQLDKVPTPQTRIDRLESRTSTLEETADDFENRIAVLESKVP